MSFYNQVLHEKLKVKNRDPREVAYEVEWAYTKLGYKSNYRDMVMGVLDNYDKFGQWTIKQEMFLKQHLAYIKAERNNV